MTMVTSVAGVAQVCWHWWHSVSCVTVARGSSTLPPTRDGDIAGPGGTRYDEDACHACKTKPEDVATVMEERP
jgi:hypothetical protein